MTRGQRADALMRAATRWQNGHADAIFHVVTWTDDLSDVLDLTEPELTVSDCFDETASAALSLVCAIGYDIDGAEKVASFAPAGVKRREDGSEFTFYRAVRL